MKRALLFSLLSLSLLNVFGGRYKHDRIQITHQLNFNIGISHQSMAYMKGMNQHPFIHYIQAQTGTYSYYHKKQKIRYAILKDYELSRTNHVFIGPSVLYQTSQLNTRFAKSKNDERTFKSQENRFRLGSIFRFDQQIYKAFYANLSTHFTVYDFGLQKVIPEFEGDVGIGFRF